VGGTSRRRVAAAPPERRRSNPAPGPAGLAVPPEGKGAIRKAIARKAPGSWQTQPLLPAGTIRERPRDPVTGRRGSEAGSAPTRAPGTHEGSGIRTFTSLSRNRRMAS